MAIGGSERSSALAARRIDGPVALSKLGMTPAAWQCSSVYSARTRRPGSSTAMGTNDGGGGGGSMLALAMVAVSICINRPCTTAGTGGGGGGGAW
eukprot:5015412-Prymnesium_polylepis.1